MDRGRSGRGCQRTDALRVVIKTVPRLPIPAVPSPDGRSPHSTRSRQKDSAGCPDLLGNPGGHRGRTARLGRALAVLAGPGRSTRRLPRHRRVAYERLIAEQFAIGLGPGGTRVAERQPRSPIPDGSPEAPLLPDLFHEFGTAPLPFQMGVPAQDAFPFKLWSRILSRETRRSAAAPVTYPDPRGDPELRKEVAAYLALARGVRCNPSQVLITGGFTGALGLAMRG